MHECSCSSSEASSTVIAVSFFSETRLRLMLSSLYADLAAVTNNDFVIFSAAKLINKEKQRKKDNFILTGNDVSSCFRSAAHRDSMRMSTFSVIFKSRFINNHGIRFEIDIVNWWQFLKVGFKCSIPVMHVAADFCSFTLEYRPSGDHRSQVASRFAQLTSYCWTFLRVSHQANNCTYYIVAALSIYLSIVTSVRQKCLKKFQFCPLKSWKRVINNLFSKHPSSLP